MKQKDLKKNKIERQQRMLQMLLQQKQQESKQLKTKQRQMLRQRDKQRHWPLSSQAIQAMKKSEKHILTLKLQRQRQNNMNPMMQNIKEEGRHSIKTRKPDMIKQLRNITLLTIKLTIWLFKRMI